MTKPRNFAEAQRSSGFFAISPPQQSAKIGFSGERPWPLRGSVDQISTISPPSPPPPLLLHLLLRTVWLLHNKCGFECLRLFFPVENTSLQKEEEEEEEKESPVCQLLSQQKGSFIQHPLRSSGGCRADGQRGGKGKDPSEFCSTPPPRRSHTELRRPMTAA